MQKKMIKLCIGKFFVVIVCALSFWVSPVIIHSQTTPKPFKVNSTGDKGDNALYEATPECWTGEYLGGVNGGVKECTLRAAIEQANITYDRDTIIFDIPGTGPYRIQPMTPLPIVVAPIIIDGYKENPGGATPNTNPLDQGNNAKLMIILDGIKLDVDTLGRGVNGLVIEGGNSEVRGLVIQSFHSKMYANKEVNGFGIVLGEEGGNLIEGNFIGTSVDGKSPMSNVSGVCLASSDNTIKGNVISGNYYNGIQIGAIRNDVIVPDVSGNKIWDNYIGTTRDGNAPLPNDNGIRIELGAHHTTIGKAVAGQRNVLSGNRYQGILIEKSAGGSHLIEGNFIGTDGAGATAVGNGTDGIDISGSSDNIIRKNIISGNGTSEDIDGGGILIVGPDVKKNLIEDNKIGTDATGTKALPNRIGGIELQNTQENTVQSNLISGNDWHGVTIFGPNAKFNNVYANKIGTKITEEDSLGNTKGGVVIFRGSENIIDDNLISGNKICGVYIKGPMAVENMIVGNKIGTNGAGDKRLPNAYDGIYINKAPENFVGGSNLTDRNIISGNNRDGIRIIGKKSTFNYIRGNYIGIAKDGTTPLANYGDGIHIENAPENVIGGTLVEECNTISGNFQNGIVITGATAVKNKIQGNYIGTDKDGVDLTGKIGNSGNGVVIDGASENVIGGAPSIAGQPPGNIISNNWLSGIYIKGSAAKSNEVQGNVIGRDKNDNKLGNEEHGVLIEDASANMIGDRSAISGPAPLPKTANVISGNTGNGVRIQKSQNNVSEVILNTIRRNTIYDNKGLGINLVGREADREVEDDVTPNDPKDADTGSNNLMNFPVGVTALYDGEKTHISGVLATSNPEQTVVDIYLNQTIEPTGFGEGKIYLGSVTPQDDGVFHLNVDKQLPYPFISATATDTSGFGSTSEFSQVYSAPNPTGVIDSDGDGLPDEWEMGGEKNGIDFDGNGKIDLNLKALGAKWDHKDVFVEIDYMKGWEPFPASLEAVRVAFKDAPLINLDGQPGIALHSIISEEIPHILNLYFKSLSLPGPGQENFEYLKYKYFGKDFGNVSLTTPSERRALALVAHYCIFSDIAWDFNSKSKSYETVLGVGETHGDDFTLGFGILDPKKYKNSGDQLHIQAEIYMHELGHNLGLSHGGPIPFGIYKDPVGQYEINFKPNYLSVMNYLYSSFRRIEQPLDYSRFYAVDLSTLHENSLDESEGVDNGQFNGLLYGTWPKVTFTHYDQTANKPVFRNASSIGPIDWNQNGTIDSGQVKALLNDPGIFKTPDYRVLESRYDWSRLIYNFRTAIPHFTVDTTMPCLTPEQDQALNAMLDSDQDGFSNADDNAPFISNPDQTDSDGNGIGDVGELLSLNFSASSVPGNTTVTGTVSLLLPAPSGGLRVELYSSNWQAVEVPHSVTIPSGAKSTAFTIITSPLVTTNTPVTIWATYVSDLVEAELIVGPPLSEADLEVGQSASPDPATLGDNLTFTITVINNGPDDVTGVALTDSLPSEVSFISAVPSQGTCEETGGTITCDLDGLANGEQATVDIAVTPLVEGPMTNVVNVTGADVELAPQNNTATLSTTVNPLLAIVVNAADDNDDGMCDLAHCSLREAIRRSNTASGVQTITFAIPGTGPHSIQPMSALPEITDPVIIDGATEPDFTGSPVIELDGSLAGSSANGLYITAGNSTIRGLAINRFRTDGSLESGNGILLKTNGSNVIEGCYLGVDLTGSLSRGNEGAGILALESTDNLIGGTTPASRNIISGNHKQGILLGYKAHSNRIEGNYIGTNATGDGSLGNSGAGVKIVDSGNNTIGGATVGHRNIISGNTLDGINMNWSSDNLVQGNYIGTNISGDNSLGNKNGVTIVHGSRNQIGGTTPGAGNLISGNDEAGIAIFGSGPLAAPSDMNLIRANLIGTAADGTSPLGNGSHGVLVDWSGSASVGGINSGAGNTIAFNGGDGVRTGSGSDNIIRGNSIFSNGELGIDNYNEGVTANRTEENLTNLLWVSILGWVENLDVNFGQNYPVLTHAFSGSGMTTIEGTITFLPLPEQSQVQDWIIDFYSSVTADPSGYGEGATYLGSTTVTLSTLQSESFSATFPFEATFPVEVPPGHVITATSAKDYQTSEFSQSVSVLPDTDGDGVIDTVENAGPNSGDANNDGTPDSAQNRIAALPNAVDGSYVVLEASPGVAFREVQAVKNPSSTNGPPNVTFPVGFFEFMLIGSQGTVTVTPSVAMNLDTAYNFGPTVSQPVEHWYQLPGVSTLPNGVVLPFSDGGQQGDHDLTINGQIIAQTGPASMTGTGTTLVVNTTDDNDDGTCDSTHCSLREAINSANFLPGKDLIAFNIPGPGPHTIQPISTVITPGLPFRIALPKIDDPVIIDGYTQPGASPATDDMPAVIKIELDGSLAEGPVKGLDIRAGSSVVRGLTINRFRSDQSCRDGAQIVLAAGGGNVIEGNHIGTDVTGTVSYYSPGCSKVQRYGIIVDSPDNIIGGTIPAARNVISGFSDAGVYTGGPTSQGSQVSGNYIGTDATGTAALGNRYGIWLDTETSNVTIGGTAPGTGNLLSGNLDYGVYIATVGMPVRNNLVQGNFIGTDAAGTSALANGQGGVFLMQAENTTIGGAASEARNLISGNNGNGITISSGEMPSLANIIQGNFIGTDLSGLQPLGNTGHGIVIGGMCAETLVGGTTTGAGNIIAFNGGTGVLVTEWAWTGNAILSNSIFDNDGLGIDLGGDEFAPDGVTPNDSGDGDFGPNELQNFPVLTSVTTENGATTIQGALNSLPNTVFHLEFFVSSNADSSSYGEGEMLLDAIDVTTDGSGVASFTLSVSKNISPDHVVTATATDPNNNSSEFSNALAPPIGELDFGDAPDPSYSTLLAQDGARHVLVPGFYLGSGVDADADGQPTTLADGDDADSNDDEDGVVFTMPLTQGNLASIEVTASATGRLDAWIDFNGDGDWLDADEQIFNGTLLLQGGNTLFFTVPATVANSTFARFRFSSTGGLSVDGLAPDGEVEDYAVTILAVATNVPPNANDDQASTVQENPVTIDVLVNDSDPDENLDQNTLRVLTAPINGSTTVDRVSTIVTYVPASGFVGTDSFTYEVQDIEGLSDTAVVTVTVLPGNNPPVANDDTATTDEDTPVNIDVTANDTDVEGTLDPTTVTIWTAPSNGYLTLDSATGIATYTPESNFNGTDTFLYKVSDADGASDTALATVNVMSVNDAPVADDDEATTIEEIPVTIDVAANDSDVDGNLDLSTVTVVNDPASGSITGIDQATGKITYTSLSGFTGKDTFTYQISDADGLSDTAIVSIRVLPSNNPPLAQDDEATTDEDTSVMIDVTTNDSDPDGNLDLGTVSLTVAPTAGSAVIDPISGTITYTPDNDFDHIELFAYEISDTEGASSGAVVTVTVNPLNDPPVANDDIAFTNRNIPAILDILFNDNDVDDDPLSIASITQGTNGTVILNTDHTVTYTPHPDFSGTDSFTYTISDGLVESGAATVTVTVLSITNVPPVADDLSIITDENTPANITLSAIDADGDPLTYSVVASPTHGVLSGTPPDLIYTPDSDYNGSDTFTYKANDGQADSNIATVTIVVEPPMPPTPTPSIPIPEPAIFMLFGVGLLGMMGYLGLRRQRNRKKAMPQKPHTGHKR